MVLKFIRMNNQNPWRKTDNMDQSLAATPDLDTLSTELGAAIAESGVLVGELSVISRQPNVYSSTFPSEIITCRLGDRHTIGVLCKYSAEAGNESYGTRGGVEYEADVYRHLLQNLDLSCPAFYGVYREPANKRTGLVLEYLAYSVRIIHSSDPGTVFEAAAWIGRFHALCSTRVSSPALSFLNSYDPEYYRGWARRTLEMAEQSGLAPRWLETVCSRFDEVIEVLSEARSTIIHGEYYPKNILLHDGLIYPVDWESTAIACGEIDLATLTEGWGPDEIETIELEYQRARWPQGSPYDFHRVLGAARIYIQFRWLGDPQACLPEYDHYLDALHRYAEEMGLI
jgi:hypothetical protein